MGNGRSNRTSGTRRSHRTSNSQPPQPDQTTVAATTPPSQTVSAADQERIHKEAAKKQTEFENIFFGEDQMRHIPSELMMLRRKVEGFKLSSTADDGGSLGLTVNKISEDFQQMTKKIDEWVSIEGMSDQDSQIAYVNKRLLESHAGDVQTIQARYQTIAHANMVIEDHGANLTSGKQFLEEYRLQADQYKRDGKDYPETRLIDQAKENISKYKDEDKRVQKVRTDASQDIADKWKKDDPLRKEVENKVKESEKLHSEAKEYRSGNDKFQKVAGDLEGTVRKLAALYTQVILTEPEKVRSGVRKLEEAQKIKRDLEKRAPEIAALYKKTGRKKLKVKMSEENVKVLAKFSEDLRQLQEMSDSSNSNLNQQMPIFMHRRKREAENKYQGKMSLMLSDKVTDAKQTIMHKMDEYISSDTKWKFHKDSPFMTEMKAEEETYADEKESLQKIYEDELLPAEGKIRIRDAGDYIDAKLYLCSLASTRGAQGNIRAGSRLRAPGLPESIVFTNPAPGAGGRYQETLEETRERFCRDVETPAAVVKMSDYEQLVRKIAGLCIHKVRAVRDEKENKVTVAVKPWSEEPLPRLSALYQRVIAKYLDAHRLLTVEICLAQPQYVAVDVRGTIYVKRHYEHYREEIEEVLREHLDYVRGEQQFGETLKFDRLFYSLERLECVESVQSLQIYPQNRKLAAVQGMDIVPREDCLLYPGNFDLDINAGSAADGWAKGAAR